MNYHQELYAVIDYIGQHLDEDISLECLSDVFGTSNSFSPLESHEAFTRAFKKVSGQSPSNYRKSATGSDWLPPYQLPNIVDEHASSY